MYRSLMQVYAENSQAAFDYYKKIFDAKEGFVDKDDEGNIIHMELDLGGQVLAIGGLPENTQPVTGNAIQFCLHYGKEEVDQVHRIYEVFKKDAEIRTPNGDLFFAEAGFELVDKYGVWWCIFA